MVQGEKGARCRYSIHMKCADIGYAQGRVRQWTRSTIAFLVLHCPLREIRIALPRHGSRKSSATHSYQCVQCFLKKELPLRRFELDIFPSRLPCGHPYKQWCRCQCFGFLMRPQMLPRDALRCSRTVPHILIQGLYFSCIRSPHFLGKQQTVTSICGACLSVSVCLASLCPRLCP